MQYAVFAAYHLSLETSFLADEGATLPKMIVKHSTDMPESATADTDLKLESLGSAAEYLDDLSLNSYTGTMVDYKVENVLSDSYDHNLTSNSTPEPYYLNQCNESEGGAMSSMRNLLQTELQETVVQEERDSTEVVDPTKDKTNEDEFSGEYLSATDGHQCILAYFSSHCVSKGTVCERTRLLRIKFYGSFDKPLGRYLRDDLFDQVNHVYFSVFAGTC